MSYRHSMGTMYATAGLGVAATPGAKTLATQAENPKFATSSGSSSASADAGKEPRPVQVLQLLLQGRGFDPGSIDGVWGSRTQAALRSAVGDVRSTTTADRRTVYLAPSVWARIEALPVRAGGGTGPAPEPSGLPSMVEDAGGGYMPWVLGAGALLAVGGYFVWQGRKKKMAANRRRRRARRSRR